MKRTILAFGDSNTYGTPPMGSRDYHPRFPRRWPVVMAENLNCDLIEAGLGGRTAAAQTISGGEMYLDGPLGLRMALLGHGPIDDLLIMLGTNDMQARHGRTAEAIVASISNLLSIAHETEMQARHNGFRTLLICPPPALEGGTFVPEFRGAAEKSGALPRLYHELSEAWDCAFLDAGAFIGSDPRDGVHFGADAHTTLGNAVASELS